MAVPAVTSGMGSRPCTRNAMVCEMTGFNQRFLEGFQPGGGPRRAAGDGGLGGGAVRETENAALGKELFDGPLHLGHE